MPGERPLGRGAELDQVVDGADDRQAAGDPQGQQHVAVGQVAQEERAAQQSGDDEQAAHGGRGLLALVQAADFGRIALDRLAEMAPQPADQPRSQQHGQQEADHRRQATRGA